MVDPNSYRPGIRDVFGRYDSHTVRPDGDDHAGADGIAMIGNVR